MEKRKLHFIALYEKCNKNVLARVFFRQIEICQIECANLEIARAAVREFLEYSKLNFINGLVESAKLEVPKYVIW